MSAIEIFIFVFSLIHSFEFVCLFDLVPVFHCKINHLHNINRVWFELVFFSCGITVSLVHSFFLLSLTIHRLQYHTYTKSNLSNIYRVSRTHHHGTFGGFSK